MYMLSARTKQEVLLHYKCNEAGFRKLKVTSKLAQTPILLRHSSTGCRWKWVSIQRSAPHKFHRGSYYKLECLLLFTNLPISNLPSRLGSLFKWILRFHSKGCLQHCIQKLNRGETWWTETNDTRRKCQPPKSQPNLKMTKRLWHFGKLTFKNLAISHWIN